jgi:D-galactarolactone cycloisomerase
LVEYLTGAAFIDELPALKWRLDGEGMLAIPDAPGLGIDPNPDALRAYTDGTLLAT